MNDNWTNEAQLMQLRREIDLGMQDIEEGRVVSGEEVFRELERRVSKKNSSP